jgi:Protein of unknown function (DUF3237)
MAIELVPLCTLRIQFKPIEIGTGPAGTRLVGEFTSVHLQGDRLRGEMAGSASADWLLIGPEGIEPFHPKIRMKRLNVTIVSGPVDSPA